MMKKVRHVLGISGGKDSAALAIYLNEKHPELDIEYYFCDTGKELDETYNLINNLENYLGKKIIKLQAAKDSHEDPFDHFHQSYGGFLPSSNARWCTKKLKLDPFEKFVGNDPVISYVGIRGDENREGYISKKENIQSIFPFRKNIWSVDVVKKVLDNKNIDYLIKEAHNIAADDNIKDRLISVLTNPINPDLELNEKLDNVLNISTKAFNDLVFKYLKSTSYPLSKTSDFGLIDNEDILIREDIFRILRESGVGVPKYYEKVSFEVNGKKGEYARSRSGCFFCFFQQKIEWVWLYEQHPERFKKAMKYEKDGYTWMQDESLEELIRPERIKEIKEDALKKSKKSKDANQSPYLMDKLAEAEGEGCAACFI